MKDHQTQMALLRVLGHHINKVKDDGLVRVIMKMKFKLKLSYESWKRSITLKDVVV